MNTPRKILNIVGLVFFTIVFIFVGIAVWTQNQSMEYGETAVPYIKKIVPEISTWKPEILREHMLEDLSNDISLEELSRMTKFLSKVGALRSMSEPMFHSVETSAGINNESIKLVSYQVLAQYENGEAMIHVTLIDKGDFFKVYAFNLDSDALLD